MTDEEYYEIFFPKSDKIRYVNKLIFYFIRKGLNEDDAEDVVQEAFKRAWEKRKKYKPDYGNKKDESLEFNEEKSFFFPWILKIADNINIKNYRKKKAFFDKQDNYSIESIHDKSSNTALEVIEIQENNALQVERKQFIQKHLDELSSQEKEIYAMRNQKPKVKYKKIAAKLGITEGGARIIMKRVLEKLSKNLRERKNNEL